MADKWQNRRGTASAWTTANPILDAGEVGVETDTGKFKIGDGTTQWNTLDYAVPDPVTIPVLLIDNAGTVPPETPVGTLIFEKAAEE